MFETHIEKINHLLVCSVEGAACHSGDEQLRAAAKVEHYARALAALHPATQAGTVEDALWCAEYTASIGSRFGKSPEAVQRQADAVYHADAAVDLFRKRKHAQT